MIETTLRSVLLSDPAIAALVSDRVLPIYVPESASLPALTYQRQGTAREYTQKGPTGRSTATIGITCWAANGAESWNDAHTLAALVRLRLDGFTNQASANVSPDKGPDVIRYVRITNESDVFNEPQAGEGVMTIGVSFDLEVAFVEPVLAYQ